MSISPTDAQTSSSSSSRVFPRNPSIVDHGVLQSPPVLIRSPIAGSAPAQIPGPESLADLATGSFGSMASAAADPGRSSKKIAEIRTMDGHNLCLHHENLDASSQGHSAGQTAHLSEEQSRAVSSSQSQPSSGSVVFSGNSGHSVVRKTQMMNANHLLNFHYDPISRPQPRMPPPRRQHKLKPYNKDLFLQANFKFVMLDYGNYAAESVDPDKMLQWENVVCVRYSTPFPVQCPICLESPLCPQITSCGHIFCFPCILRYLMMGEEDHKGACWKKCPLCFMMVSSKDLYTIYIENVKHYIVGDAIQFTLLTRAKDSLIPSEKNQQGMDAITNGCDALCDSFSKFTLISDVELSVREAYSELNDWLARADSGFVNDMEQLPYVCAAIEQLEQRKKCWTEYQALTISPPLRNPPPSYSSLKISSKAERHLSSSNANSMADSGLRELIHATSFCHKNELKWKVKSSPLKPDEEVEVTEGEEVASTSYDEEKSLHRHLNGSKRVKEKDSYTFYQAVDGQHLFLHPLNMKCLLNYYGSYDLLPARISGEIVQLETVTQSEATRRRYRYLSHLSLTTTFQLCEINLGKILPSDALSPFMDEIKKRETQRKRLAKKELQEKAKADAAAMNATPMPLNSGRSSYNDAIFSMDDFEALGSAPLSSTSPPIPGERKLFSNVTRLGFAAGHDSPALKVEGPAIVSHGAEEGGQASGLAGQRNLVKLTFSNIISTAKSPDSMEELEDRGPVPGPGPFGRKGKKPNRVLMSTAGTRRY